MNRKLVFAAAFAAVIVLPTVGAAEDRVFATVMAQYVMFDNARPLENDFGAHLGLAVPVFDNFALELNYLSRSVGIQGGGSMDQSGYGVDALWFFDRNGAMDGYLLLGIGRHTDDYGAGASDDYTSNNFGVGLMDAITDNLTFRAELRVLKGDDGGSSTDVAVGVGLVYLFGEPAKTMAPAVIDRDSDGDGVLDSADRCPGSARGSAVDAVGCAVVAAAVVDGDGDRDGVADSADRCPETRSGVAVQADGCAADSDGDGVRDPNDKCPATPSGTRVLADGCPVPTVVKLEGVNFETGSDRITVGSRTKLDEAVLKLNQNPTVKVEVAGHTDGAGDANSNRALSQKRADAVRDYLVAGGVASDQVTARGYGEDEPTASNDSADGRAANRRVELRVKQ